MGMAIDSKKLIERLNKSELKKNYTFALTPSIADEFKEECDKAGVKASPVIEELMKEFLESSKKKK